MVELMKLGNSLENVDSDGQKDKVQGWTNG